MDTTNTNKIYLMMNKPCGYVCSAVSDSHKTVYELLSPELQTLVQNAKRGCRLHTVGRLDCQTSGLMLFTDDGNFSNNLTRPQNRIPKTYEVILETPVEGALKDEYIECVRLGVILAAEKKAPEQKTASAKLEFLSPKQCRITVTEGKFHEVRRIFTALGNKVQSLKRISTGPLMLPPDLPQGSYRPLTDKELNMINSMFLTDGI